MKRISQKEKKSRWRRFAATLLPKVKEEQKEQNVEKHDMESGGLLKEHEEESDALEMKELLQDLSQPITKPITTFIPQPLVPTIRIHKTPFHIQFSMSELKSIFEILIRRTKELQQYYNQLQHVFCHQVFVDQIKKELDTTYSATCTITRHQQSCHSSANRPPDVTMRDDFPVPTFIPNCAHSLDKESSSFKCEKVTVSVNWPLWLRQYFCVLK